MSSSSSAGSRRHEMKFDCLSKIQYASFVRRGSSTITSVFLVSGQSCEAVMIDVERLKIDSNTGVRMQDRPGGLCGDGDVQARLIRTARVSGLDTDMETDMDTDTMLAGRDMKVMGTACGSWGIGREMS